MEIFGLHVVDLASEFYKEISDGYQRCKNLRTLVKVLQDSTHVNSQKLLLSLDDNFKALYDKGHFIFEDDLLYYRRGGCHRLVIHPDMKETMLKLCHDDILAGHFSEQKSLKRLQNTAWWLGYKEDMHQYVSTCDSCQKANKKTGKRTL